MNIFQHRTCNDVLRANRNDPMQQEVDDLPITRAVTETANGNVEMVASFWKPDAEELAALNAGASVCLMVLCRTHPPVCIGVADD